MSGSHQTQWSQLFDQIDKAERLLKLDPSAAVARLRSFGESLVGSVLLAFDCTPPTGASQFEKLRHIERCFDVDRVALKRLHALRILGNRAAHGQEITRAQAEDLRRDAESLARWFKGVMATQDLGYAMPETLDDVASSLRDRVTAFGLRDAFDPSTLSEGQTRLVCDLEDFLAQQDQRVFLLKGYAGTGKTFMIKGLTEFLCAKGRSFRLAAPTGRAAKVVSGKTGAVAITLHRLIYNFYKLIEFSNEDDQGPTTYRSYFAIAANELPTNTVFIVDEVSLLSNVESDSEFFRSGTGFLLNDLLSFVGFDENDHDKKIIFIGGPAQLCPVNMATSPALDEDYLRRKFRLNTRTFLLTDVMRQKPDSGLMANIAPLRDALQCGTFNQIGFDFTAQDIVRATLDEVMPAYLEACDHAVNDRAVIVCRSNAESGSFNRAVRQDLFPGQADVSKGDKLMVVANTYVGSFFIPNGEFVFVHDVAPSPEVRRIRLSNAAGAPEFEFRFRKLRLGVRDAEGRPRTFEKLILENLLYSNDASLNSDEQKALYRDFCIRNDRRKLGDLWREVMRNDPYMSALRVKFGYAVTCHKAQGGEWGTVFVNCPSNEDPLTASNFRWLYTAMTRAKERLFLINPPAVRLGGGMREVPHPPVTGRARSNVDDHGLEPSDGILYRLLLWVRKRLEGSGVRIVEIGHNAYQEAYYFSRHELTARINISYTGDGRITWVTPVSRDALSAELEGVLGDIKGMVGGFDESGQERDDFSFSKAFFAELYARVQPLAKAQSITITKIEELQWKLRYTFSRSDEVSVFDIVYDSKSRFKNFDAVPKYCFGLKLRADVSDILKNGLS